MSLFDISLPVTGKFPINLLEFDFQSDGDNSVATYKKDGEPATADLKTFVSTLSPALAGPIPTDISIKFKSIKLVYNKTQFAIAFEFSTDIGLCNLPIIGSKLPPELSLSVENIQVIYSSGEFSEDQVAKINPLLPEGIVPFDEDGIGKSMSIMGDFQIPGQKTLKLNTGGNNPEVPASGGDAVEKSPVHWFNIHKTVGPVTFNRIGATYKNKTLTIFPDASLEAGGLTLSLLGLSVSSPIDKFSPSVNIDGLGIDFNTGGVEIGGSFLKTGTGDDAQYNGTAIIKAEGFTISALGSYTKIDGHPSLFIYAYLDQALGGPSFFYVEGLAMGFGYNRSLIMPTVDTVDSFPLIEQVMGEQDPESTNSDKVMVLQQQLAGLAQYIPPTLGEMFFAVGVKFNTFKLIDSFALLAISFGNRIEIDILGQSNVVVPAAEEGEEIDNPLAEIKILLVGKYIPDDGFLAIEAQLSPDSYIFSKDCHLTGGAAYYSWFSGEHKGDFVVTMGGYHPKFTVPAHYPQVPRLALNWQITDDLSIKGDMYFALCAHAFMAGGHLEALFEKGDFKAWFKAGADFLVVWQPYHYEAKIYVDIGASLYVDLWLTSFTITVDYGADVEIWGPEFSGKATVHIYVCDITISFGAGGSTQPTALEWGTFRSTCLPDVDTADKATGMAINNGMHGKEETTIKGVPGKLSIPIVNPKDLEFSIDSMIPLSTITVNDQNVATTHSKVFGAAPMDKKNAAITSSLKVTISYSTDGGQNFGPPSVENFNHLSITPSSKAVPSAIWGEKLQANLNVAKRVITVDSGISVSSLVEPPPINSAKVASVMGTNNDQFLMQWSICDLPNYQTKQDLLNKQIAQPLDPLVTIAGQLGILNMH